MANYSVTDWVSAADDLDTVAAAIETKLETIDTSKTIRLLEVKALPGGKVEIGETVEEAIRREMIEEVNLELQDLRQFHVYSDPKRDFRHHSIEVTHIARAYKMPTAGYDEENAFVVKIEDIPWDNLAFDHAVILRDYLRYRNGEKAVSLIHQ